MNNLYFNLSCVKLNDKVTQRGKNSTDQNEKKSFFFLYNFDLSILSKKQGEWPTFCICGRLIFF